MSEQLVTKKELETNINNMQNNLVTKELFNTKVDDLKELMELQFDSNKEEHKKISSQQKITNGSVKDLKAWRLGLVFAWTVVTATFPVIFYLYTLNNDKDIDIRIEKAITEYDNANFETN